MSFNPALLVKLQPSTLFTDPATIPNVQPQLVATQFWTYNAGSDTAATVLGAGYFHYFGQTRTIDTLLYNNGQLFNIGDIIWVHAADDNIFITVTAVTPTILTAAGVNPGDIALASAHIFVGSAGGLATDVAMTGDVTISNTGVTAIGAAKVTKAMLAATVRPAAMIVLGGNETSVGGGGATEAYNIPGIVAATDLAFCQIVDNGTNNVTLLQAVCTNDTLTITYSADPGADTVFNYQIVRATA